MELRTVSNLQQAVALLAADHHLLDPEQALLLLEDRSDEQLLDAVLDQVGEIELLKTIAAELGIRFQDLYSTSQEFLVSDEVLRAADTSSLIRYNAFPLVDAAGNIVVAIANPSDAEAIDYLRSRYRQGFQLMLSPRTQVQNKLAYYSSSDLDIPGLNTPSATATQAATQIREVVAGRSPVQEWVDATLARAVAESASDVHFMINADKTLLLRFRVDGVLNTQRVPAGIRPVEAIGAIVARCETMDSANYKEPQDGTFSFQGAGRNIDARVAMMPQLHGPTLVVRLLDSSAMGTRLDDMGFSPDHLAQIRRVLALSQGTIIAVGPTGAGKTTTLWGMMREIDAATKHVQTVENPVEYRLPLVGQTEIRHNLGDRSITFARALRTILRLDPDVVLVGEIRDAETAEVTMQAAITGHLVLSSLHANSAVATFPRLTNMGIPSFLVTEAIDLVISQRLIRRAHECAQVGPPNWTEVAAMESLGLEPPESVARAVGCGSCRGTGYRGRVAAAEVLTPSRDFKAAVVRGASNAELTELARFSGLTTIAEDGMRHLAAGRTTVPELIRVLASEENS